MLSNADFHRANARFLRREAEAQGDARAARLRAIGLTRADLVYLLIRGMR